MTFRFSCQSVSERVGLATLGFQVFQDGAPVGADPINNPSRVETWIGEVVDILFMNYKEAIVHHIISQNVENLAALQSRDKLKILTVAVNHLVVVDPETEERTIFMAEARNKGFRFIVLWCEEMAVFEKSEMSSR